MKTITKTSMMKIYKQSHSLYKVRIISICKINAKIVNMQNNFIQILFKENHSCFNENMKCKL